MIKKCGNVFIIFVIFLIVGPRGLWAQTVTFAQFTDPHLYDAASHLLPQAALEEFLDNRTALEWAVLQVNRLQSSGKHIDFVAITGDFGLDVPKNGPIPSLDDYAVPLNALIVKMIVVVPGNNDLVGEKPADIGRFRTFVKDLQARMPDHDIVDLTQTTVTVNHIRLVGLDSASFKNAGGNEMLANRAEQLKEMTRLAGEIKPDQPHIIFTHIPDVEDPYRGSKQDQIHGAWQVDKSVAEAWSRIIDSKEVIGVFAGHFHDPRRTIYGQDFSWTSEKPDAVVARKTWIAPPLAAKFQENAEPQARGFLLVTAAASGGVTATPYWYGFATQTSLAVDKAADLLIGNEDAKDEDWQKAALAYERALDSSDPGVRALAADGYQKARAQMRTIWWRQKLLNRIRTYFEENWIEFALKLAFIVLLALVVLHYRARLRLLLRGWLRTRTSPIIMTPAKYTSDAPVDLFAAEISAASENLRAVLAMAAAAPIVHSRRGSSMTLYLPSQGFQLAIDSLPDVKGINLGKFATLLLSMLRFFSWRIESGLATANNQAVAVASLRHGWRIDTTWRVSGSLSSPVDLEALSRELAYNILGISFVE